MYDGWSTGGRLVGWSGWHLPWCFLSLGRAQAASVSRPEQPGTRPRPESMVKGQGESQSPHARLLARWLHDFFWGSLSLLRRLIASRVDLGSIGGGD